MAFLFGLFPDAQILAASYSSSLAKANNRAVQRIMESKEYKEIFPNTRLGGSKDVRSDGKKYIRNMDEFEIVGRNGMYACAGVNGAFTGKGADFLVIDDPVKNDKEANSQTYRDNVWEWWTSTAFTRLMGKSRCLIIMTRWHEDDLAGRLLQQAKADPGALQWRELKLDAIKEFSEVDDKTEWDDIAALDPREVGEALWPDVYPASRLKLIEKSIGPRWWNSLYQQRPTALEGGIIKSKWIQYYNEMPSRFNRIIQSWDATFNDNKTSDFVVGTVWGEWGNKYYLLDMVRGQMSFYETCEAIDRLSKKWPQAIRKLVEKKANGDAILNSLKRKGFYEDGTERKAIIGLVPVVPTESKGARLEACSTLFAAGDVLFPHPSIAPWVNVVVEELVKYPNATYDDCVDSTSQALNDLAGTGGGVLDKILKL